MTIETGPATPVPTVSTVRWRDHKPWVFYYWFYDFDRGKWFRLKWRKAQKAEAREIN